MIPEAIVGHSTHGRLRLKVPSMKGKASYFSTLKEYFTHFEGVKHVDTNVLTGSLVLIHSSDLRSIVAFAEDHSLFKLNKVNSSVPALSRNIVKTFSDFDKGVKRFTGNELDVPGVAFLTLAGFGVYEIARGNFAAPAWYTAFWYSLNIFLKSLPKTGKEEADSGVTE
jgi:Heavy metal associated domain 2